MKLVSSGPGATYGGNLSARVTREPGVVRIALGDLALTARGLDFAGHGGEVQLGPGGLLSVRGLALDSAAGNLEASGSLTLPPALRRKMGLDKLRNPMLLVEEREGGLFLHPAVALPMRDLPKAQLRAWIARDEAEMKTFQAAVKRKG